MPLEKVLTSYKSLKFTKFFSIMTEIEKVDGVETENTAEVVDEVEETQEESTDTPDEVVAEKPQKESDESRRGRLQRELTKLNKKLGIENESKSSKSKKSDGIDYAQEAYLLANGIKEADEIELVQERMSNTGKSLKEVLASKYLQEDLKELRDAKSVKEALPSSSKRSNTSARNTVEYWIGKLDSDKNASLLDIPDVKLRRQVVNARLQKKKDVNHFTDNPLG